MNLERSQIGEDREGLPLRLELQLLDGDDGRPLPGVMVEIWHADASGRYSGFDLFVPPPGEDVTAEAVPTDVVLPEESFLRGSQRTGDDGRCHFETIYPGWYASRTVHIHVMAHVDGATHTTQLYFDDALTDEVFRAPPYRDRAQRDTTNATDSIYADVGVDTLLEISGDPDSELNAALCCLVDRRAGVLDEATVRAVVHRHVEAVGAADPRALEALYAPDARLEDPAGADPVIGAQAIGRHFADVLTVPRDVTIVGLVVTNNEAAVHFKATPEGGNPREIIDTMTLDGSGRIVHMRAYAN